SSARHRPPGGVGGCGEGGVRGAGGVLLTNQVTLVILVGLPASGKSTYFREHFAATHLHVSKDLLARGARQEPLIDKALAAGRSVVVDNTNPSPAVRAPLIALGRRHGARIVGY